jgi:hypothetical protein
MPPERPDIRMQSSQITEDSLLASEEESIYGYRAATEKQPFSRNR